MIRPITLTKLPVIEFGIGQIETLISHLAGSKRAFFLIDQPILGMVSPLLDTIRKTNLAVQVSTDIVPEPAIETLEKLLDPVKQFNPDVVVGIGGGSTMDLAKLTAVLFTGEQNVQSIIGIGNVRGRNVKLITASTTSGTGSEVTPIAVLTDTKAKLKKGVVSPHIVPDVAIIDPQLTFGMPAPITASTGMDAMTHCIEAFTNRYAHPIVDTIAREGVRLIAANIETAVAEGKNPDARTAMALGSLYGGMCLGPVNTAAVHALAYPLGGTYHIPHGVSNSVLLPFVMTFNLPACTEKYAEIAHIIGAADHGSSESAARQAIAAIRSLSMRCGIPASLKELGIPESAIESMAKSAMDVTRLMGNNPRTLTVDDTIAVYRAAYTGTIE
jgi:alcohol dehydrogenase class IV